jgi:hypothetical protein
MEKPANYTAEQEKELVERYEAGETTARLAELLNKSEKSIIAKLSRLGVYKSTKPKGPARKTKAQMVTNLEETLELECGTLSSFEKADRTALESALEAVVWLVAKGAA